MKPAHPDNMTGISDEVYIMQCRQLSTRELEKVKRKDLAELVMKERKMREVTYKAEERRIDRRKLFDDLVFKG